MASYEQRFRRAGLPLFIEDYTATGDVFTRAVPLLALVFISEVFGAIDLDWSVWANLGAVAGGLAIVLGAFAVLNRVRGRRWLAVPEDVGRVELAGFVIIPAVLPAVFGGQTTSALVTLAVNATLLLLILGVVGFGLLSIVRWAAGRLLGQLMASVALALRALPLLLLFSLVLFVNTEAWQVFSSMPTAFLILVFALFAALGSVFIIARLPREVSALEKAVGTEPPLERRQRVNVGLVMFVSQALQVLVVALSVAGFFVVFGALAIGPEVRESWIGSAGNTIGPTIPLFGEDVKVTTELLAVSAGIGAFSALYYAIAVLTDATYRDEFLEELTSEMTDTFQARADYLAARAA